MCNRRLGAVYCTYAGRYRGYQVDPPELDYEGPSRHARARSRALRFGLRSSRRWRSRSPKDGRWPSTGSRPSAAAAGSFALDARAAAGLYTVRVAAKELRTGLGLKDRDTR